MPTLEIFPGKLYSITSIEYIGDLVAYNNEISKRKPEGNLFRKILLKSKT